MHLTTKRFSLITKRIRLFYVIIFLHKRSGFIFRFIYISVKIELKVDI